MPGLLDLALPWTTLAGLSAAPGLLGRIGPVAATQARQLATAAEIDPAAQWRIIITNPAGQAIAVTRIPRRTRAGPGSARDGPPPGTGLVGRITLTIGRNTLASCPHAAGGPDPPPIAAAALRTATRALSRELAREAADAAASGCAHRAQSDGYRPPPRLREQVTARDITCRNPACRQPARRADLDHTRPWQDGGPTCPCNLMGTHRSWRPRSFLQPVGDAFAEMGRAAGVVAVAGTGVTRTVDRGLILTMRSGPPAPAAAACSSRHAGPVRAIGALVPVGVVVA